MSEEKKSETTYDGAILPPHIQVQPTVQATATLLAQTLTMRFAILSAYVTVNGPGMVYVVHNFNILMKDQEILAANIKSLMFAFLAVIFSDMFILLLRRNALWVKYYSERLRRFEEYIGHKAIFPMFSGSGEEESPNSNKRIPNFESNVLKNMETLLIIWVMLSVMLALTVAGQLLLMLAKHTS